MQTYEENKYDKKKRKKKRHNDLNIYLQSFVFLFFSDNLKIVNVFWREKIGHMPWESIMDISLRYLLPHPYAYTDVGTSVNINS